MPTCEHVVESGVIQEHPAEEFVAPEDAMARDEECVASDSDEGRAKNR